MPSASTPRPPTITYALLGLLAIKSWTGYELTQQARLSLRLVWPSSEAHVYREQQRLVRMGWATVTAEQVGKRTRNRYTITDAGRSALTDWLATEPAPPAIEVEVLVRAWFADQGGVSDLVSSLERTAAWTEAAVDGMLLLVESYLAGEGAFPERAHLNALVGEIVADVLTTIGTRCRAAAEEVAQWDTTRDRGLDDATRARFQNMLDTYGPVTQLPST